MRIEHEEKALVGLLQYLTEEYQKQLKTKENPTFRVTKAQDEVSLTTPLTIMLNEGESAKQLYKAISEMFDTYPTIVLTVSIRQNEVTGYITLPVVKENTGKSPIIKGKYSIIKGDYKHKNKNYLNESNTTKQNVGLLKKFHKDMTQQIANSLTKSIGSLINHYSINNVQTNEVRLGFYTTEDKNIHKNHYISNTPVSLVSNLLTNMTLDFENMYVDYSNNSCELEICLQGKNKRALHVHQSKDVEENIYFYTEDNVVLDTPKNLIDTTMSYLEKIYKEKDTCTTN